MKPQQNRDTDLEKTKIIFKLSSIKLCSLFEIISRNTEISVSFLKINNREEYDTYFTFQS